MNPITLGPIVLLHPIWLLAAFILLLLCFLIRSTEHASDWMRVFALPVYQYLSGNSVKGSRWNLALLAATLVALALTQPVIRQSDDDTWRHSIGWVALVDVSRSMTLNDTVPSRLSAAREALATLSAQSGSRPIALIIYAGDAFLAAPPAFDKSVFDEHAALLEHGVVPIEGSNLARALSLASSVIAESRFVAARVFLLHDSAGIGPDAMAAARHLSQSGHSLDVLLFGEPAGGQADANETRVDPASAQALASAGNGVSVQATAFGQLDYAVLNLDDNMTASSLTDLHTLIWKNQSHWLLLFAIPALLLLFHRTLNA